ncbi:ATP-grasp domain-containing protein [Kitasatospora sp. CM 4170]|uniref:ATP-grasp domain-containing protein n=1 Tax=Kitasatospora aburaviensis TaxID=67265 RepID=A0ABW1EXW2_9ACTN|nr:ATP-grasp domain-containing protein [Kitasatospora sp. CM 4170]WNM46460.1 ATP-grasp domain-containing protein [Kitasatospora sp. CM 4170]
MSAPVRVWLNRTYAENVFFIEQLRAAPRPVLVHATHVDADSPVLAAADHAALEPGDLTPDAYVAYALDYCARHSIDVFLPRLNQLAISLHHQEFEAIGTALACPPATAIAAFDSKADGYAALAAAGLPTPPWWQVRSASDLLTAVDRIEAAGLTACLKPVSGAGGEGFRVLTREPFGLHRLAGWDSRVQVEQVAAALDAADEPADLLVMPFLDGPEVSVDCLADRDGTLLAAVGRSKHRRRRSFTTAPRYLEPARRVVESTGMAFLSNVQFRHLAGEPIVIDVNTRPSGGLHQLRLCGLNLPWNAVQLALGERPDTDWPEELAATEYTLVAGIQPVLPREVPFGLGLGPVELVH